MTFWMEMLENQVLMSAVVGWVVALVLKTIIDCALNKGFSPERLYGSGGMPSSHSSTVCALTVATAYCYGLGSGEFAISFVLAAVVMYDAMGVRRETGKQAKLLNLLMEQDFFKFDNELFQKRLKEFVGHTPLQVAAGAVLGILIAVWMEYLYV